MAQPGKLALLAWLSPDVAEHRPPSNSCLKADGAYRKKERTTALVTQAVKAGFRGVDTACQPKVGWQPRGDCGICIWAYQV
jgi:hypothetical protein